MNTVKFINNSVFLYLENDILEYSKTSKNYYNFIVHNGGIFYLVK